MRVINNPKPELLERMISASCYLCCGLSGLIYILISGKNANSRFFRFHFLQSIIIGIFTYLLAWAESIARDICAGIIGLLNSILPLAAGILGTINGILFLLIFIITKLAYLLLLYGLVFALLGKYAEIPGVSRLVYRQLPY